MAEAVRGRVRPEPPSMRSGALYSGMNAGSWRRAGCAREGEDFLVVQNEGWERLYGGLAPSLVGTAASQGVYYFFYQIFRSRAEAASLRRSIRGIGDGSVGMFQSLTVAALSGCVNVLLTNPIWVVVTRMQTHRKANKQQGPQDQGLTSALDKALQPAPVENVPHKTINVIQDLYKEAGAFGFWKGVIPALIMVSNPAIQFMLYETLLKKLKKRRASNFKGAQGLTAIELTSFVKTHAQVFLLGAVAKLGATLVTYPLLVVKARLQAKQMIDDDKRHRYKGTFDAITKMMHYEGLSGLYKGMGTKIVQSVFASALLFMIKEELVKGARFLVTGDTSLSRQKELASEASGYRW
uniref:Mitochondrial substrate carrier family protein Q n=1 Tax=Aegilops tauschii TaxID=37682 RepID=M8B0H5_AEGTA